jgi:S1-C subfamily serine protease
MAKRKALIEKNQVEREKEKAYGLAINSLDKQSLSVQLLVLKVFDDAILARGYCSTYAMPPQFWVTGIGAKMVDGDRWQGDVYNVGRLTITAPDGVPYTFRVFSASKEEAAKAIVEASMPEPAVASAAPSDEARAASGGSTGTGWFCKGGYIVTCYHVVQGRERLSVVVPGVGQLQAQLVQSDSANDIALLKPSGLANMPLGLPLAQKAPAMGDSVFTLGFPHTDLMGKSIKLSDGIVSSLTGYGDDPRTLQISVPVQSGNSGGPLINAQGEVVGIVASKLAAAEVFRWTGDMPQNVNYAIKTGYLNLLLEAVPENREMGVRQPVKASLGEVAGDAAGAVVLVIAE